MAERIRDRELHRIVTTCIIYKRDRYLIKKRHPDRMPFPGRWEVPGGGMEPEDYTRMPRSSSDGWDDVLERVVRREVRQEVGLEIGTPRLLGNSVFVRPHDGIPVLVLRFAASYGIGRVVLDDEATEHAWIAAKDAPRYDLIGSIGTDIEKLDAFRKRRIVRPAHT